MTDERDFASVRETPEWVIAVVGSTLADGTPNAAGPSPADVAEAAERILISCRESGQNHVVTSSGVWALAWLQDGEVIEFARDLVGGWLEAKGLELKWVGNGDR
jgi:hypothetical protein